MLQLLRTLIPGLGRRTDERITLLPPDAPLPGEVVMDHVAPFPIAIHLHRHQGLPIVDWRAVESWMSGIHAPEQRRTARIACQRAWLQHLRSALGQRYRVAESDEAILLSSLESNLALAALDFMNRTRKRIVHVLEGIARPVPSGKDLQIVFDDEETYYRYVSYYYPSRGEFAFSGGMYLSDACGHFVTVKADLRSIEPVIAHEMTHGCVAHLPLPLWLNEGLAVNTEHRLVANRASRDTPQQMQEQHRAFWSEAAIQEFWSGESFGRTDEGSRLSYDLARIMVEHMAMRWDRFKPFVLDADRDDAGVLAARQHLGIDLGAYVCALLEKKPSAGWAPDSKLWRYSLGN